MLIFEADNTAVVHNINSPELFPYKAPQMRRYSKPSRRCCISAPGTAGARGVAINRQHAGDIAAVRVKACQATRRSHLHRSHPSHGSVSNAVIRTAPMDE